MARCMDCIHYDVCEGCSTVGAEDCPYFSVPCNDCKHSTTAASPIGKVWCKKLSRYMETDAYCSYGERKDNEVV
jgi:coenzyme F420-reducing hydrogenase gamma subunit